MKNFKTLILEKRDVQKVIDIKKAVGAVEKAFAAYARKKTQMPAKIYLHLKKYNGDFRAMPAFIDGIDKAAVKWVNVHPDNKKYRLPTVMAVLVLSDPRNGFPLCIMDGTLVTNIRTAAAGGVAAKYLARKDSRVVGLVGCGEQAKTQLLALRTLFPVERVKVWGINDKLSKSFVRSMRLRGEKMEAVQSVEDCVGDCGIVVTTTPSRKPLVKLKWLRPGVHINAIGADAEGKTELEPVVLKKGRVVIDDWMQASHSGEINVSLKKKMLTKKDIYASIGDVVIGKKRGRTNNQQITVFDSTGLAIQDVAVADMVYKAALRKKMGKKVRFV